MKKQLLYALLTFISASVSICPTMAQSAGGPSPVITEIMYNPPESGNDTLEFLEILNPSLTSPIAMGGYYFSSGIEYTFPAGFVLGAGEYVLLSSDSVIFETWYGQEAFEWTGGTALDNGGEGLALRNGAGFMADTVFFDDTNAWADADATGYSLVLCDPTADNNSPTSWTLSENATGLTVNSLAIFADPGAASTCTAVGIADEETISTVVYPNPTTDVFTIRFDRLKENTSLDIHNAVGQLVYTQPLAEGVSTKTIDADLKQGLYIVSLTAGDKIEQIRLVVE